MKSLSATPLTPTAHFDLETFMMLSETRRIEGGLAARLEKDWERLFPRLKAFRLGERKGYLVVFMEPSVEEEVDELWNKTPSRGFELQTLAQAMIMSAMQELLPEAGARGCAPVPEPNKILKRSLKPLGLEFHNTGAMNVKYGVLTRIPSSGGCEQCYLRESCPRAGASPLSGPSRTPGP